MASQASNEVKLPRAVLRVSKHIEDRLAEQRAAANPPETPPAETPPQAPVAETPPAPTPPAPPAPAVDRENDAAYWKHRFQTADGIARAEMRREHAAEVATLNQRITELQEQVRTVQAAAPKPPIDLAKVFKPEEIEKYGEEQCRAMVTAATTAADERMREVLEAEVKPLKDAAKKRDEDAIRQQTDAAENAKAKFLADVRVGYPKFDEVDVSPGWIAWLNEMDENTGLPRGEILTAHAARHNAPAVVKMFKTYEALTAPPAPPVAPHGGAADGGGMPPPATPAPAGGAPTDAEVREFFKRVALDPQGKKVSREEKIAFEARMKLRRNPQTA